MKRFDPDPSEASEEWNWPPGFDEVADPKESLRKAVKRASGPMHAILDESGNVVPIEVYDQDNNLIEANLLEWAKWFEHDPHRRIQNEYVGDHWVSTIFCALNQSLEPFARPLWFETLVFGPPKEEEMFGRPFMIRPELWRKRVETKTEALAAHAEGVAWLKDYLSGKK